MAEWVCGTGDWTGPAPGDPNFDIILSASGSFGGITVSWTYPATNPHAVAHVVLFRSTDINDLTPIELIKVNSNYYFDRTDVLVNTTFFYWARVVSINGTVGDLYGPVSAVARPTISDMVDLLSNKIENSWLANSLNTTLSKIEINKLGIDQELIDRAASDAGLAVSINQISAQSDATLALIQSEQILRADGDQASIDAVDTLYVQVDDNTSAIQVLQNATVDGDGAFAERVTTVQVDFDGTLSTVQDRMVAAIGNAAIADDKAVTAQGTANSADTKADTALSNAGTAQNAANTAQASADNIHNALVNPAYANRTFKLDVNGYVTGFGLYNNGAAGIAIFDVDTFAVGNPGVSVDDQYPFMISGGKVYIKSAYISNLDADVITTGEFIGRTIKTAESGWRVEIDTGGIKYWNGTTTNFSLDGFGNATFKGNIDAAIINGSTIQSGTFRTNSGGGRRVSIESTTNDIKVYNSSGAIVTTMGDSGSSSYASFGSQHQITFGITASGTDTGVYGVSTSGSGIGDAGVYGLCYGAAPGVVGSSGSLYGVYGTGPTGVYGNGTTYGVYAQGGSYGVYASSTSGLGLYAVSSSNTAIQGVGSANGGTSVGGSTVQTNTASRGLYGYSAYGRGVQGNGGAWDFYAGSSGTYGPFTGGHEGLMEKSFTDIEPGDIVVDGILISTRGICDAIFTSKISTKLNKKAVGVFARRSIIEEVFDDGSVKGPKKNRVKVKNKNKNNELKRSMSEFRISSLKETEEEEFELILDKYDSISFQSIGEGLINVCDYNGNFQDGDLISTCPVPGKGARQSDNIVRSYTVAQIRLGEDQVLDWAQEPNTTKLVPCFYLCG